MEAKKRQKVGRWMALGTMLTVAAISSMVGATGTAGAGPMSTAATSWSLAVSPNRGAGDNVLNDVSCADASHCVAVGNYTTGTTQRTLVEEFANGKWSVRSSRNRGTTFNNLQGVSCPDATHCFAVGYYSNGTAPRTLVEKLVNGEWTVMSSPNGGAGSNYLTDVSCPDATHCFAIGASRVSFVVPPRYSPLIMRLSGGQWSLMDSASGIATDTLSSISCPTIAGCYAVGETRTHRSMAQQLSGGSWSLMSTPNRGTSVNRLSAVSCPGATRCYAMGEYVVGGSLLHTLAERLSGTTWTKMASPNGGARSNELFGVSCPDTQNCAGVGVYQSATVTPLRTLVVTRSGGAWSLVSSPNRGTASNVLQSVSCFGTGQCFAVGYYFQGSTSKTLILSGA